MSAGPGSLSSPSPPSSPSCPVISCEKAGEDTATSRHLARLADVERSVDSILEASAAASRKARELNENATKRLMENSGKREELRSCVSEAKSAMMSRSSPVKAVKEQDDFDEEDDDYEALERRAEAAEARCVELSLELEEAASSRRVVADELTATQVNREDERLAFGAVAASLKQQADAERSATEEARSQFATSVTASLEDAAALKAAQKEKLRAWKLEIKRTVAELEEQHAAGRAKLLEKHANELRKQQVAVVSDPALCSSLTIVTPRVTAEGGSTPVRKKENEDPLLQSLFDRVHRSLGALETALAEQQTATAKITQSAEILVAAATPPPVKPNRRNMLISRGGAVLFKLLCTAGLGGLLYAFFPFPVLCYLGPPPSVLAH